MYRGTFERGDPAPVPCGRWRDDAALRLGAKPAQPQRGWAGLARRCVRGIFPGVHAAGKNDLASFRRHRRRKPGRGSGPFLDFSRTRGRGMGVPGRLRSASGGACYPARRKAALPARGPLRRWDGGRGTGVGASLRAGAPGQLPASIGSACWPPGAALRRRGDHWGVLGGRMGRSAIWMPRRIAYWTVYWVPPRVPS